jgi:hypothetical protein
LIELDGDVHVPMYEKFKAEREELKRREDTKACARQGLCSYAKSRNDRVLFIANEKLRMIRTMAERAVQADREGFGRLP